MATNIPQVSTQVVARPVSLAVDNSGQQKLDQLRQSLSVFQSGVESAVEARDKSQAQADVRQAVVDQAAGKPYNPADGSEHYYKARMSLIGESHGLDLEMAAQEEAKRLADNPDELKGVNVDEHMTQFIKKQYAGLDDPVSLERVLKSADSARAKLIPHLLNVKSQAIKAENEQGFYETARKKFELSTPDEFGTWLGNAMNDYSATVPKQYIASTAVAMLRDKIAGAAPVVDSNGQVVTKASAVAESYLKVLSQKLPGTDSTVESLLGADHLQTATQLRGFVGTLKANEQALLDQAENERRAAAKKEFDKAQELESIRLGGEVDIAKGGDLAGVLARIEHANLSDVQRERLRVEAFKKQAAELEKAGLVDIQDGERAYGPRADNFVNSMVDKLNSLGGDPAAQKKAFFDARTAVARKTQNGIVDFNKKYFEGVSTSMFDMLANGDVKIDAPTAARIEAFSTIADDAQAQAGIPEADRAVLAQITRARKLGIPTVQALQEAAQRMREGRKPVASEVRDTVTKGVYKDISKPWFGTNLAPDTARYADSWTRGALDAYTAHPGVQPDEVKDALVAQFNKEHLRVGDSLTEFNNAGLVSLTGVRSLNVLGKDVPTEAASKWIERGANEMLSALRKENGDMTIVPLYGANGVHVLHRKDGGPDVPVSLETMANLGAALEQEQRKRALDAVTSAAGNPVAQLINKGVSELSQLGLNDKQKKMLEDFKATYEYEKKRASLFGAATVAPAPSKPNLQIPPPPLAELQKLSSTSRVPPEPPAPLSKSQRAANKAAARGG